MKTYPILLLGFFFITAAHAAPVTRAQIVKNHKMCLQYLKLSPARKNAFAARAGHRVSTITKSCRFTTGMGIDKTWYYERMYQRQTAGRGSSPPPREREPEYSPSTPGTCYSLSDCYGSSVQVSSKSSCPAGYGAFKPSIGGGGCERR